MHTYYHWHAANHQVCLWGSHALLLEKYSDPPLTTRPSSPCHDQEQQINTGQTMIKAI